MPFSMLKYNSILTLFCIILSSYTQPALNSKPKTPVVNFEQGVFKIKGAPFKTNGIDLQFQYIIKKNNHTDKAADRALLIAKKLVDMKTQTVVCNLEIAIEDEKYPEVNISEIEKEKYGSVDFEDVNFDGYQDIREFCEICGGATNSYEYVYLFNPRTKKFQEWTAISGAGIEVNKADKTVTSTLKDGGDFSRQEFKFKDRGVEIYEKQITCTCTDVNNHLYKIVYDKYVDGKVVTHKTQFINSDEHDDIWNFIEKFTK